MKINKSATKCFRITAIGLSVLIALLIAWLITGWLMKGMKVCDYCYDPYYEEGYQKKNYWICDNCASKLEFYSGIAYKQHLIDTGASPKEIEWAARTMNKWREDWELRKIAERQLKK